MSTWLTTIVMNSARMVKRKRRRSLLLSLDGDDENNEDIRLLEMFPDTSPGPEAQLGRRELEDRLGQMLHHLSPNLREVIRFLKRSQFVQDKPNRRLAGTGRGQ